MVNLTTYSPNHGLQNRFEELGIITIGQGEWIKNLKDLDFKDILIIELPKPKQEQPILNDIYESLTNTWKYFQRAEWNQTLGTTRFTMDKLTTLVRGKGHLRIDDDGKERTDWKGFFGSETLGDIVNNLYSKLYKICSSQGSHGFKSDASPHLSYFSVLQLSSLVYLVNSQIEYNNIVNTEKSSSDE
jgi:hypothetical protein